MYKSFRPDNVGVVVDLKKNQFMNIFFGWILLQGYLYGYVIHSWTDTIGSISQLTGSSLAGLDLDANSPSIPILQSKSTNSFDPSSTFTSLSQKDFGFNSTSAYTLTGAILLLVTGSIMTFYGYHILPVILFLVGFYLSGLGTLTVLNTLQARGISNFEQNRDLIYLITILLVGILGGMLLLWLKKVGILLIGGCLGFLLGSSLLQIEALASIGLNTDTSRILVLVIFAILGMILVSFFEVYILIGSTSVQGSFAIFVGLDFWIQSGFGQWFYRAVSHGQFDPFSTKTYLVLAGFVGLSIVGMVIQYIIYRNKKSK